MKLGPTVGFRLVDKKVGTDWVRTKVDFLKPGDIFRFVRQDGVVEDDRVFRCTESYREGKVMVEEIESDV